MGKGETTGQGKIVVADMVVVGAASTSGSGGPHVQGGQEEMAPPLPKSVLSASQEGSVLAALREGRSFANVAGAQIKLDHLYQRYGAQNLRIPPGDESTGANAWSKGIGGPERKRRNVVQLKYIGSGQCPTRAVVVDMILGMGFKVADLFAIIHPYNSMEFDASFMTPVVMELFITKFELARKAEGWKDFNMTALSRQEEVKTISVLARNESLPPEDIATWLSRYGQVVSPLKKTLDVKGIWTGAWTVKLKLSRRGYSVAHVPASAFIGRDRILVFYPGQPRLCFKCGSPTHLSRDCLKAKCVKCNGLGHTAESCQLICCNLCGEMGHPFSRCPKAFRGDTGVMSEEDTDDECEMPPETRERIKRRWARSMERREAEERTRAMGRQAAEWARAVVGAEPAQTGGQDPAVRKKTSACQVRRSERRAAERAGALGNVGDQLGGGEARKIPTPAPRGSVAGRKMGPQCLEARSASPPPQSPPVGNPPDVGDPPVHPSPSSHSSLAPGIPSLPPRPAARRGRGGGLEAKPPDPGAGVLAGQEEGLSREPGSGSQKRPRKGGPTEALKSPSSEESPGEAQEAPSGWEVKRKRKRGKVSRDGDGSALQQDGTSSGAGAPVPLTLVNRYDALSSSESDEEEAGVMDDID